MGERPWVEVLAERISVGLEYDALRGYAEAQALMYLLKEGKSEHRRLFKQLMEELPNRPPAEVIRDRFSASTLRSLATELQGHVGSMRLR